MDAKSSCPPDPLETVAFFDAVQSPLLVLDRNHNVLDANACYCRLFGVTRAALIGRNLFDAFPEAPSRQGSVRAAFDRAFTGETVVLTRIEYAVAGAARFFTLRVSPILMPAEDLPDRLIVVVEDDTAIVKAERMRDAVAGELQHRIANLVSLIAVIAKRTFGERPEAKDVTAKFLARLRALGETNRMVSGETLDGTTLDRLARGHLEPYLASRPDQIEISGPEVRVAGALAQALSMAIHELTTNAAKHGVLGEVRGSLRLHWSQGKDGAFHLEWREDRLDPIVPPARTGFRDDAAGHGATCATRRGGGASVRGPRPSLLPDGGAGCGAVALRLTAH